MNTETASYQELRSFIKNARANSQKAVDFFGDYTHATTADLREWVQEWLEDESQPIAAQNVVNNNGTVGEIRSLLEQALNMLKTIPEQDNEAQRLHNLAMEIEAELEGL